MNRRSQLFTMTELLVVIGIIAILAGILVPAIGAMQEKAKKTAAEQEMQALASVISQNLAKNKKLFGEIDSGYSASANPSYVPSGWGILRFHGLRPFRDYLLNKGYATKRDVKKVSNTSDPEYDEYMRNYPGSGPYSGTPHIGLADVWSNHYRFIVARTDGYVKLWSQGPDGKWCKLSPTDSFEPERDDDSSSDYIEDDIFVKVNF